MEDIESHVLKRFDLIKRTGKGCYGIVYKAYDKKMDRLVGLKKIYEAFRNNQDAQRTYREVMLLQELSHPNIITLYNVIKADNDKDIYLSFEYFDTDLHTVIRANILDGIQKKFILFQIFRAVKYLHLNDILHRDLKPPNILMNSNAKVKICDFGLARTLNNVQKGVSNLMTEYVSTRWYRSPEILLGSARYSKESDIWSIGCIFAEMIGGAPIFPGTSTVNQLNRILEITGKPSKEDINSLQSEIASILFESISSIKTESLRTKYKLASNQELDLLNMLLQFNPTKRLTAEQALEHPYFQEFSQILLNDKDEYKRISYPLFDNVQYNLKEYRAKLYEDLELRKKNHKAKIMQKNFNSANMNNNNNNEILLSKK